MRLGVKVTWVLWKRFSNINVSLRKHKRILKEDLLNNCLIYPLSFVSTYAILTSHVIVLEVIVSNKNKST